MLKLAIAITLLGLCQQALVAPSIDLRLASSLKERQRANIIVTMKESPQTVLNTLKTRNFRSRGDRLTTIGAGMKAFASRSQGDVLRFLSERNAAKSFRVTSLWVTNQIAIRGADRQLVEQLLGFSEIQKIEEEFLIELDTPLDLKIHEDLGKAEDDDVVQWGVEQIEAPRVWSSGNKGEGIVVGTVDTGARGTHESLVNNFYGDYGWFDPGNGTPEPNDGNGHGTHTTATIAGRARNVGVAPGARWAACKGCATIFCSQTDLFECGQFFACPTKADGSDEDCSKAPHVVSNSWGGGQMNTWYKAIIEYYHVVGIIPVFSQGNGGPSCGSASSPGDYANVIGVGATEFSNVLAYFSSVGPTVDGRMKPDVAAPGAHVFSAYYTTDVAYVSMSGTSMACPHAAGVITLMLAENPAATYSTLKELLQAGGVPTNATNANCGGVPETQYPNHHVGHGRINAFNSVRAIRALK